MIERARRSITLLGVAAEVARERASSNGVPPPEHLARVQRAATRAGGLPATLAQCLTPYTGWPSTPGPGAPIRLAGRVAQRDADGSDRWRSWGDLDPASATDHRLLGPALRLGLPLARSKLTYLEAIVRLLGDDVAGNASSPDAHANADAMALSLASLGGPTQLHVRSAATDPVLVIEVRGDPSETALARSVRMLEQGQLCHGRLAGAGSRGLGNTMPVPLWETARRVSVRCREALLLLIDAAGSVEEGPARQRELADVVGAIEATGAPADNVRKNLPALLDLLAPVARPWQAERASLALGPPSRAAAAALGKVRAVPDEVGLLYGLGDLLSLRPTT